MGRQPTCCQKQKLRRGLWSPEEDEKLINHISKFGHGCWSSVPKQAGLQRCGKSCRLRWMNYLRPDLKRGAFSKEEDDLIVQLRSMLGNRWSAIAARLPGRTDNEIKNHWNSYLKKRTEKKPSGCYATIQSAPHPGITTSEEPVVSNNAIEGSSSNDSSSTTAAKKSFSVEIDSVSEYFINPSSSYDNEMEAGGFVSCNNIAEWLDLAPNDNVGLNFELQSDFSWADETCHIQM